VVKGAAAIASAPVSVVEALGTAVHRCPPIEVIKNPAGRFGLADMVKNESDSVAVRNV
jgi:hypothetical protein